ncbi:MAG: anthranilate phosphoribosyltransferase [Nitrospinae bacterium]|nr:anthranilate phosphoribosyltransferase [Nitrospinota bacterium]
MKILRALHKVSLGNDLDEDEMGDVFEEIMSGEVDDNHLVDFLTALKEKGESVSEITGAAKVMRKKAETINVTGDNIVDTCGTGGSGLDTFNISTTAAFVVAGAGIKVAKHGNRAVSSSSGSADVLECLGVDITADNAVMEKCIEEIGIGFLFAPNIHKAMKHAINARKVVGRSIFNLLGPLTNPAKVTGQVLGVYDAKWTTPMAEVLKNLGRKRAMVVHGMDGMDEITLTHETKISELRDGKVKEYVIDPGDFNMGLCELDKLFGGSPQECAAMIMGILTGFHGRKRDIVLINAAAGIVVGGMADDLKKGYHIARNALDCWSARDKLIKLGEMSFSAPMEEKDDGNSG